MSADIIALPGARPPPVVDTGEPATVDSLIGEWVARMSALSRDEDRWTRDPNHSAEVLAFPGRE